MTLECSADKCGAGVGAKLGHCGHRGESREQKAGHARQLTGGCHRIHLLDACCVSMPRPRDPCFVTLSPAPRLVEHHEDPEGISIGDLFARAVSAGRVAQNTLVKVRVAITDTGAMESFWLRVLGRLTDADDAYLAEVANELVLPDTPPADPGPLDGQNSSAS